MYEIYTDGSCMDNPNGPGGWAAIIKNEDGEKIIHGGAAHTTNNRMEMAAIIYALLSTPAGAKGVLYSDSQYLVNGLNSWAKSWKKNNWTKKDGEIPKNVDLWKELMVLSEEREISFVWVKGHVGNELNERCDLYARKETNAFASIKGGHSSVYDCEKQFAKGEFNVETATSKSFEEKVAEAEKAEAEKSATKETDAQCEAPKSKAKKSKRGKRISRDSFVKEMIIRFSERTDEFVVDLEEGTIDCNWANAGRLQDIFVLLGLKYETDYVVDATKDGMRIKIVL